MGFFAGSAHKLCRSGLNLADKGELLMWADVVIEGGGVKVIGLLGALRATEQQGFRFKRFAGTSAGSIVATLLAAGYTSDELYQILMQKDLTTLLAPRWHQQIPYLGPALRLWIKKGLYSGQQLERWFAELLAAKGIYTFADLDPTIELSIIASDITKGNLLVLPKDLSEYGYQKDQMSVAKAVRMSCSIPYFFEPVKWMHQPSNRWSYIVDGAVLSNFPVWIFDQAKPRWPTFGFRLFASQKETVREIHGPFSLFYSMFMTMMDAHDNRSIREQDQVRTIMVPTVGVKLTDFSITKKQKEQLYLSGVKAANQFFKTWSFKQYLHVRGKESNPPTYTIRSSSDKQGEGKDELSINFIR